MSKKKNLKTNFLEGLFLVIAVLLVSIIGVYFAIKNLSFGLDLQGGFEVLYNVDSIDDEEVTPEMVNSTYKIIEKRINALGVSEPEISIEGNNIRVVMAGVSNIDEARKTISTTANLTFRTTDGELLMTSDVLNSGKASTGYSADKGYYISLSVADKDTFYKKTKQVSKMEDNYIVIWLDYDESYELVQGDKAYTKGYYTEEADGTTKLHTCGDIADSACLSYAGVSQGFASDVIIEGNFTKEEVDGLVDLINSGSMPTKLTEISSKTVSASFGENSLNKTFTAGVVGILLIALLLIVLYRFSGLVSSVCIIAYTAFTLIVFNLVGGRLTLQGIAALVIGIGMAVDSSVITFSRIKEELKRGVSLKTAYYEGSKESFTSILDANVTTFIAAFILFIFGESSVKGFATMLIISIVSTFLIMIYLNKYLMGQIARSEKFEGHAKAFLGYKEKQKESKFDYVKPKNIVFILVGLIVIGGGIFIYKNGMNLGIDFKGGSTVTINSKEALKESSVIKDFEKLEYSVEKTEVIDSSTMYVTISDVLDNDDTTKVEKYFNKKYDATTSVGAISNEVKKDLTKNALKALLYACIGMIIYISIRFKFSYAISAILALLHDSVMTFIIFNILGLEIDIMFIAAILSIIGYSINNTIVIFDRIRENKTKLYKDKIKKKEELIDVVNTSLRQTVMRCIITTVTTIIPVISLIVLGSYEIINFNVALLIGFTVGTFSSLFISSQIWMLIEKKNIGRDPNKHWYDDNKKEKEELKIKGINC